MKQHIPTQMAADNTYRDRVKVLLRENSLGHLDDRFMDGSIYVFHSKLNRMDGYKAVVHEPEPYLSFLVELIELKKLHPSKPYLYIPQNY